MLRINPEKFKIAPKGRIVKAQEYSELLEAKGILKAAHEESAKIIEAAQAQAKTEREKGHAEGLKEGQAELSEKMVETVSKSSEYIADFEKKLIHVIMDSLRSILGEMEPEERILKVANKALNVMRNQKQVVLEVCPDEADVLKGALHQLLEKHPTLDFIEVKAEPRMQPGDCTLRTPIGSVEAGIHTQLQAIENALNRSLKASNATNKGIS